MSKTSNYLTLEDLDTDPPKDAKICQKCHGYGVIPSWEGFAQSSKDCDNCQCKGWVAS